MFHPVNQITQRINGISSCLSRNQDYWIHRNLLRTRKSLDSSRKVLINIMFTCRSQMGKINNKKKKMTKTIIISSFFPQMRTNLCKPPLFLNKTCHCIYSKNHLCMAYLKNHYFHIIDQNNRSSLVKDHSVKDTISIRLSNQIRRLGEQTPVRLIPSMSCLSR